MGQSKKDSHTEVMMNQIVGIVIGWLIVFLIFPAFDHWSQFWVATTSSCLFFVSSYARSYTLRRLFNRK